MKYRLNEVSWAIKEKTGRLRNTAFKKYSALRNTRHLTNTRHLRNTTESRNRTDTVSPPPDFESGASTSSAIPAFLKEAPSISISGVASIVPNKSKHIQRVYIQ
jgi:hypothetical protein